MGYLGGVVAFDDSAIGDFDGVGAVTARAVLACFA
jgi:hypothetical protein